ncbi:hypothetical protein [Segetibacter sp.]|jgi:hypothetical protein|uniref:hypothetical protein n=1 Tax=Segetibacter sp. TaxID=2231182 RepID=UPI002605AE8D|nr:hypothetical protein [Segetibacter sp.]MCW3082511.1 hypothetical protein [Segetibacter sp.]
MKKLIVLLAFLLAATGGAVMAQGGGGGNMDPAQMRERQLTQLKASDLKLTDAQADSVVSINMESRQQMRGLRDLSDDQRAAKMKEMNDMRLKRWSAALKDEALAKRVADYYEKQRAARANGGGGSQQ